MTAKAESIHRQEAAVLLGNLPGFNVEAKKVKGCEVDATESDPDTH